MAMARNGNTWIPWGSRHPALAANSSSPVEEPKSVILFGVKLTNVRNFHKDLDYQSIDRMMMRKSISTGYLGLSAMAPAQGRYYSDMAPGPQENAALQLCTEAGISKGGANGEMRPGYASDGLMQTSSMSSKERRKGLPWTEEEHRLFLAGLQKLGKGDWRGMSRNFVTSRTPTQVASHAQKYFLRRSNLDKRKRQSSLFDIINSNPVFVRSASNDDFQDATTTAVKHWEVETQHSVDASSSVNSLPLALANPRMQVSLIVSADLCLGHLSQQFQEEEPRAIAAEAPSLRRSHQRRQPCRVSVKNSSLVLSGATMITELDETVFVSSSLQSTSVRSLSSSSSSSSLMRIDEAPELSSLSLSIAPPTPADLSSELALKLQPPTANQQHQAAIFPSSSKVCSHKDVLLIAGA